MAAPIKFDFEHYTPAIPAIPDSENSRIAKIAGGQDENNALTVTCYTPVGNPVFVLAKDEEHKAFLLKMNPHP